MKEMHTGYQGCCDAIMLSKLLQDAKERYSFSCSLQEVKNAKAEALSYEYYRYGMHSTCNDQQNV